MIHYKFLIKPIFYISSLLFSSWVVLQIEKLSPSDFGRYKALFGGETRLQPVPSFNKQYLIKLCSNYKTGKIDSVQFDKQLQKLLDYMYVPKIGNKKIELPHSALLHSE